MIFLLAKLLSLLFQRNITQEVSNQLKRGISPCDVKIPLQLGIIKPLHAKRIVELYTNMQKDQEKVINVFKSSGITEAIQSAGLVLERVENPFHA